MGAGQSQSSVKPKESSISPFPSSAPAVVGFGGKSARRSKSARKGAKRSARRSARRSSKRGMKGGSSCMKMSGGKHRRSHYRGRGRR